MASTSIYLNFPGNTEEVFNYYKEIFGTEFKGEIHRMGQVPPQPGMPELREEDKDKVMHVALPILGGTLLMGTDTLSFMPPVTFGNNIYINLEPDTRMETDRLFAALSAGGKVETPLQEMFWGDYYGSCTDKYGVQWMFNCAKKA